MVSSNVRNYVMTRLAKSMRNVKARKTFAAELCDITGYFSTDTMYEFVQEMRGLDFYKSEDRALFCDFLFCWMKEQGDESSNT